MGLMSGLRHALRIDNWSTLNYKPLFSSPVTGMPERRAFPEAARPWVPAEDERRLAAYKLYSAYDHNQAGELAEIRDGAAARERREYGDPSMFVDTLVSHVLGREQSITVPGAEHAGQDGQDPGDATEAEMAARVQELLQEWADEELLPMRLLQAERKAVCLGDGVIHLWWDAEKQRPRITTYDPGFYFPVIGEDSDGTDFPTRVHFAWELPEDQKRGLPARLRRITYELDWIRPATASGVDRAGRPVRAPVLSEPADDEPPSPVLGRGDQVDSTGAITRIYPWSDTPSYRTVYLTDGIWLLEDLTGDVDVDSLPLDKAHFNTNGQGEVLDHLDIYQDFISVIHMPNTVPEAGEHWGQSSLAKPLQVFDEMAATDTDSARASGTTGLPMIAISGVSDHRQQFNVGPGALFTLGENGRMTAVDTSSALRELREHGHDLGDRAANVARLPAVALGTMDPSKVPSGYALELSLGPLDSNISGMRLARDHADRLIPKFVQRLFLAGQHPDWAGLKVMPAKISRGPYTPTDKAAVLDQVTTAYAAHVISLETAIRMLQDAGWPIEDAQQEIEQIQARSFEAARQLADATGDTQLVANYLGVNITPRETAPPTPQLPGLPSDATTTDPALEDQKGSGGNVS
ncbi:hypothetical protein [Streptomyces sp. SID161]|uniref:hypothetical protein n=1 Tax=Streptomyces sp. SID161 TaxID=2690251 RepID=UPI00136AC970|nr:hypothetical protein [Streptomyces sp. SID161]MYW43062.1 hypothetical protein [Streptomyces sp. SID161]